MNQKITFPVVKDGNRRVYPDNENLFRQGREIDGVMVGYYDGGLTFDAYIEPPKPLPFYTADQLREKLSIGILSEMAESADVNIQLLVKKFGLGIGLNLNEPKSIAAMEWLLENMPSFTEETKVSLFNG